MKKIIAITLLLAMALALCACGESNKEPRYVGTWQTADKTATLVLNSDGSAILSISGEGAATYSMKWTANSVSALTLNWDGEPVVPEVEEPTEATDETVAETPEETVPETVEETTVVTEATEATEAIETTEATETETVADGSEETVAEGEENATGTTSKKKDPSIVGFGSLKIDKGEIWLYFSEGSSADILLFTYAFKKIG